MTDNNNDNKESYKIRKSLHFRIDEERDYTLKEGGILFLDDEISEESCGYFCRDLIYLATGGSVFQDPNHKQPQKPIYIVLNSPGGDVFQGFAIYNFIKAFVNKGIEINIIGVGNVASMATVILQAATRRLSLPQTQFMIHQISQSSLFPEEVNMAEESVDEGKRINRIALAIIANRIGMNLDELIASSKKKNCWYSAEAAQQLGKNGLIDEIITILPF